MVTFIYMLLIHVCLQCSRCSCAVTTKMTWRYTLYVVRHTGCSLLLWTPLNSFALCLASLTQQFSNLWVIYNYSLYNAMHSWVHCARPITVRLGCHRNIAFPSSRNKGKFASPPFTEEEFTQSPPVTLWHQECLSYAIKNFSDWAHIWWSLR